MTVNIWGAVQSTPTSLSFTSNTPQSLAISQAGPAGTLTITKSCVAGADLTFQPARAQVRSPPRSPRVGAIVVVVRRLYPNGYRQRNRPAASLAIPVNITSTSIGVSNTRRQPLPSIKKPQ